MPRFEPFRGLRYASGGDLTEVTAPPYDVISDARRAELATRHPHNAVHLDLPVDEDGVDRYAAACRRLKQWIDDRVLVLDPSPAFYAYRMRYVDSAGRPAGTTGVVGALELSPPGSADVLPHEETTPKAASDRLEMLRSCRANLSAIWGLSLADGLTKVLTGALDDSGPPIAHWLASDGVTHELWVVDDDDMIAHLRAAIEPNAVLIADGHHRYQTSLQYRDERRAAGDGDGPWDLTMALLVELIADQLDVRAIHRLVHAGDSRIDVGDHMADRFEPLGSIEIDDTVTARMVDEGALVLIETTGATLLRPRPERFEPAVTLDTVRLDQVLAPLDVELTYEHSIHRVLAAVQDGTAAAGVLVRPATVDQIAEVAHGRGLMPPKTTFFNPKPSTGSVYRTLER